MNRRPSGFTIVEILVVISILAIVISLLIPSLTRAREVTKGLLCQANLRQFGIAYNNYYNDNKGFAPNTDCRVGSDGRPGVNVSQCTQMSSHDNTAGESVFSLLCHEYMGQDLKLLVCPSQEADTRDVFPTGVQQDGNPNIHYPYNTLQSFYGYNSSSPLDPTYFNPPNTETEKQTCSTFGFLTFKAGPNDSNGNPTQVPDYWHGVRPDDKIHTTTTPIIFDIGNYDYDLTTGAEHLAPSYEYTYCYGPCTSYGRVQFQAILRGFCPQPWAPGTPFGHVGGWHQNQSANMVMLDGHVKNDTAFNIQQCWNGVNGLHMVSFYWAGFGDHLPWNYLGDND